MAEAVQRLGVAPAQQHTAACTPNAAVQGWTGPAELAELRPHLSALLHEGVGSIVLTLGGLGAALCTLSLDRRSILVHHAPALPATVANCSGAGDCLVAGFMHALLRGCDDAQALAWGVAAAKAAVESDTNVPPAERLQRVAGDAQHALRHVAQHVLPAM